MVIPIRYVKNELVVNLLCIWVLRIGDQKWAAEAIRILAPVVGVIPVGTRLLNLSVCKPWHFIQWTLRWSLQ